MLTDNEKLQSCRPLSGAVIPPPDDQEYQRALASIVPRVDDLLDITHELLRNTSARASIVPPPFGSGYQLLIFPHQRRPWRFNRAAPFRERLSGQSPPACCPTHGFNRAAPFRERLS